MIKLLIFSATLLVVAEASKWGQQQRPNNRRLITWKSAQKQFSKRQKDWNDGYAWKFDTDEEMVEGAPVSAYQHVTARCNDQYPKYSVPWATCISNGFRKVSHYNDAARFDIDDPFDIAAPQRFRGVRKERCFCSNGGDGSGACTTVKYCNSRSDGGYRCSPVDNGCSAAFCLKQKVKTRFNRWCFAKGPYIP